MKREVTLAIKGCQTYQDQEPEIIELMTDGIMEFRNGGWDISYEESELTGLAGVTTIFRVEPGKVTLTRILPSMAEISNDITKTGRASARPVFTSRECPDDSRSHQLRNFQC